MIVKIAGSGSLCVYTVSALQYKVTWLNQSAFKAS